MPFAWAGVQVHAAGGAALRVRLARAGAGDGLAVHAAAPDGTPVLTAGSLVLRPVTAAVLDAARGGLASALFTIDWVPLPAASPPAGQWAVIGSDALAAALAGAGAGVAAYPDLPALRQAIAAGAAAPDMVAAAAGALAGHGAAGGHDAAAGARAAVRHVLGLVQDWLAEARLAGTALVLVTRGAGRRARPGHQ